MLPSGIWLKNSGQDTYWPVVARGCCCKSAKIRYVNTGEILANHLRAGKPFVAGGLQSYVWEEGSGEPVVCIHGVPVSAFLYRRVLPELAARGLRGIAWDLPGCGFADRPRGYDYRAGNLSQFCRAALDELEIDRFHLVCHDAGGPVGLGLAALVPERVLSLTVMNTAVEMSKVRQHWSVYLTQFPILGELSMRATTRRLFVESMYRLGVENRKAVGKEELAVHYELLKRGDGGKGFLEIMRAELTERDDETFRSAIADTRYPVQLIWGENDPIFGIEEYGEQARLIAGLGAEALHAVPAKHFLQEDQSLAVASQIALFARANS